MLPQIIGGLGFTSTAFIWNVEMHAAQLPYRRSVTPNSKPKGLFVFAVPQRHRDFVYVPIRFGLCMRSCFFMLRQKVTPYRPDLNGLKGIAHMDRTFRLSF